MEPTFVACPNPDCHRGAITTMVGRIIGRASDGHEVRSETFMVPSNETCPTCKGRGRITVENDYAPLISAVEAGNVMAAHRAVDALIPSPVFANWDDYSAFYADDLRDAAMEHEPDADDGEAA